MASHKWTPESRAKLSHSLRQAFASKRKKATLNKKVESTLKNAAAQQQNAKPLEAHYVGEQAQQPAVDINKIESQAFRRGMFTALQMVIDALVRELR